MLADVPGKTSVPACRSGEEPFKAVRQDFLPHTYRWMSITSVTEVRGHLSI